ncbi:hypothetical protein LshimejAT787_0208600 [Lyophyllum shimeji]|uniref:Uncharacterized protein n=1 Tax=Lyophyllum shimeji TaxID=47721 RepID=A0A9P3PFX2_LYOSH|nr:hypothetical protein LshimejAT787_0208600 [Lyophyllum shimeji]
MFSATLPFGIDTLSLTFPLEALEHDPFSEKMGIFYTHEFPFPSFAAYTLGVIFMFNTGVFLLLAVSLATGSGAYSSFQANPMGVVLMAHIVIGFYFLHRVRRPEREANKLRSLMTFSAISSINLINSMMLIVRIPSSAQGNLEADFAGLPNPRMSVHAAVILSCFATCGAFLGLYVSQHELPPIRLMKDVKTAPVSRRPSSTVISLYRQPVPPPTATETATKTRPLVNSTYDNWTTIPV